MVAARLLNQATLAARFAWQRHEEVAADLRGLATSAMNQETLDSLLGLEGRGAALYFAGLAESLPEEWGFDGRQRKPPSDPVNAMLSFGTTTPPPP